MKKISLAIMVLVVALASCKKTPEVNLKYVDVERDLITVGTTTATVQCDYQYIATLKKAYLYYGEGAEEVDMNAAEMRVVQNTLYVDLAGLKSNTTYSYFYEFHNGFNSMRTVAKTFKTEALPTTVTLPTVVTASVTEITTNSAKGGGEVTDDGGAEVTERGICWSTNANPSLNDSHVAAGSGTGAFTAAMSGLEANTIYHVRAYAINEAGTAYGLDRDFVTGGGGSTGVPEGAIDGLFSVSPTQKVYFSQGNLQYQASTNTWRFAENQWDYVGNETLGTVYEGDVKCNNMLVSSTYNGWIDTYGWGTSGWDCGNEYYQPWNSIVTPDSDPFYGPYGINNLTGDYSNSDWGIHNAIYNGGNTSGLWRTLLSEELMYIFNERNTNSGIRFVKAQVNGINGVIVFPDNWNNSLYNLIGVNQNSESFSSNVIPQSIWMTTFQANGAVFLPAAGDRSELVVEYGIYWSASSDDCGWGAYTLYFYDSDLELHAISRSAGLTVRLVQDVAPQPSIYTPSIITFDVSNVTANSVLGGGEVINDGGAEVTERGICWSTNANPTISNSHVSAGSGLGVFSITISGLQASTTYHARAYATNEAGTAYGQDVEFTTLSGGGGNGNAPTGAIDGLFTINENGDQIYFSQGNLQYQASTNTWRFAENQWNFVGGVDYRDGTIWGNVFQNGVKCDNSLASSTYDGWIDLFGWATSGYHDPTDPYNVQYQPWSISTSVFDIQHNMFGYGPSNEMPVRDLIGSSANYDWGVYNPIMNGGNTSGKWRTLSLEEWNYVFNLRSTTSGIRYAKANVANTDGVILLPDGWEKPESISIVCPGNFQTNIYNLDEWDLLEESGAVFLPIGGTRYNTDIDYSGSGSMRGAYWSVTNAYQPDNTNLAGYAYNLYLRGNAYPNCIVDQHLRGSSVRLVQDANP